MKLWAWIVEQFEAPKGRCAKHGTPLERWIGCRLCYREAMEEGAKAQAAADLAEEKRKLRQQYIGDAMVALVASGEYHLTNGAHDIVMQEVGHIADLLVQEAYK